jgi:hypothetical protein
VKPKLPPGSLTGDSLPALMRQTKEDDMTKEIITEAIIVTLPLAIAILYFSWSAYLTEQTKIEQVKVVSMCIDKGNSPEQCSQAVR